MPHSWFRIIDPSFTAFITGRPGKTGNQFLMKQCDRDKVMKN
ncbi:hypothetical protein CP97_02710 [Aurantiacibacter atlanticus]|uniref:Uncharacterized protein n=1 Tax=Aurantiacibacter atlanticus TaxID=1648404 RepID=A0A0H4V9P1_9SPHN|nr:hypothetical protein CP97_02710 [Aurantiacibacter atlanticus]